MAAPPHDPASPNPLELIESARTKYNLAMARARHGAPELALLSLHGSLEDVLRAHGLRLNLPAAHQTFPHLIKALVSVAQLPLSAAEADGLKLIHRLQAHVAHGAHIAVTSDTIDAYHHLAAQLLPRYGVMVVPPEAPPAATATTVPGQRGEAPRDRPPPRRERTVYPDVRSARYPGQAMPSAVTRDLPMARELLRDQQPPQRPPDLGRPTVATWLRTPTWLLPALIVLSIFLIGLVISLSLQLGTAPLAPTAIVSLPTSAASAPPPSAEVAEATADPALLVTPPATAVPPGALAVGRSAVVRADAVALNVRARPGTAGDIPIQVVLSPGTAMEIIGGPVVADGMDWWQVRAGGSEGWCAAEWIEVR